MGKKDKIKNIVFDGNYFWFKHKGELVQIEENDIVKIDLKKIELIITDNLYSFEKIDDSISNQMNEEEVIRYLIWKMKIDRGKQFFTIKRMENDLFGFIVGKKDSIKIKEIFGNKINSINPFIFKLFDRLIDEISPFSMMVIDYNNLTDFLVIGENTPFFLRKKYDLNHEEKIRETNITKNFIKSNYNINIDKVYSNVSLEIENFNLLKGEPLKIIL
jgi:hypothetical protein